MTRRMSTRRARAIIESADLVKSPDWSESRRWHVIAGEEVLVVIAPSYSSTSRSGRSGWTWWLAHLGPPGHRRESTREQAAARGLADWERWATNKEAP